MTPTDKCHLFVSENLNEIASDQLMLERTGILCDGKFRQAQRILESELCIEGGIAMSVVRSVLLTELIKFKLAN